MASSAVQSPRLGTEACVVKEELGQVQRVLLVQEGEKSKVLRIISQGMDG